VILNVYMLYIYVMIVIVIALVSGTSAAALHDGGSIFLQGVSGPAGCWFTSKIARELSPLPELRHRVRWFCHRLSGLSRYLAHRFTGRFPVGAEPMVST